MSEVTSQIAATDLGELWRSFPWVTAHCHFSVPSVLSVSGHSFYIKNLALRFLLWLWTWEMHWGKYQSYELMLFSAVRKWNSFQKSKYCLYKLNLENSKMSFENNINLLVYLYLCRCQFWNQLETSFSNTYFLFKAKDISCEWQKVLVKIFIKKKYI